jgi:hypothetical protein
LSNSSPTAYEDLLVELVGLYLNPRDDGGIPADLPERLNQVDPTAFLSLAQLHGLGPLLYRLLQPHEASLRLELRLPLQGVYLRQRSLARAQHQVLGEILELARAAGLELVLLKGAALAHLVYPEVSLRPMSDLDLLVPRQQLEPAAEVLRRAGFAMPSEAGLRAASREHRHLPAVQRQVDGHSVVVELHRAISRPEIPGHQTAEGLWLEPWPLSLQQQDSQAKTLAPPEMLWHLCHHLCDHAMYKIRLMWMLDIVLYAERFRERVDWPELRRQVPPVPNTLALLDRLWPLSTELRRLAGIEPGAPLRPDLRNWPVQWKNALRHLGPAAFLGGLFFPSPWWLRLYYGLGPARGTGYHRWLGHPLHMTRRIWRYSHD